MKKHYISAEQLLNDSFCLAKQIHSSGFKPDLIIGVWRGGTPIGIAIHEYFDYVGILSDHFPIRTSSYYGIDQADRNVKVDGLEYVISNIHADTKILIVDDVFDSGRSIAAILEALDLQTKESLPRAIKIACPWYKPSRNTTNFKPDFWLHETDDWLVFPHELSGLSKEEVLEKNSSISKIINGE